MDELVDSCGQARKCVTENHPTFSYKLGDLGNGRKKIGNPGNAFIRAAPTKARVERPMSMAILGREGCLAFWVLGGILGQLGVYG